MTQISDFDPVEYVDHMGSDLTVVNAARVSFYKHSDTFEENDTKLIKYLANHGHWTPFSHTAITVRMKTPIFIARQLFKHKVGMTENEVSRRYVSDDPEFYFPDKWRKAPTNGAKQGSSGDLSEELQHWADFQTSNFYSEAEKLYRTMLEVGVAPEQARMVLPQAMLTEWYWTGSLSAYARIYKLRIDSHAQKDTQEIAVELDKIIRPLFPVSWEALTC